MKKKKKQRLYEFYKDTIPITQNKKKIHAWIWKKGFAPLNKHFVHQNN